MQALRLPPRNHVKAEISCPPLRWRAVRRAALRAAALAHLSAAGLAGLVLLPTADELGKPAVVAAASVLLVVLAASLLRFAHALNALRSPVLFKVARGELTVTWPFLLGRRTRTLRTSDVTAIVINVPPGESSARCPTGRLSIRRRHRRSLRLPGSRPVQELDRAAEELREALHV